MQIKKVKFGLYEEQIIWRYQLINDNGLVLSIMNFGATVVSFSVPDKNGKFGNIIAGYSDFDKYLAQKAYFGAMIGPVAGRISGAGFTLNHTDYSLPKNSGQNTNHSGGQSIESRIWDITTERDNESISVICSLLVEDGSNGFPGPIQFIVHHTLNNNNDWRISYNITSEKTTLIDPTYHVYFNLSSDFDKTIDDQCLQISSDFYSESKLDKTPTGKLLPVAGTIFDFNRCRKIFEDLKQKNIGYDHAFLLNHDDLYDVTLTEKNIGRQISIKSDRNAVVIYTGNGFKTEPNIGSEDIKPQTAIAIEMQTLPDSIHFPDFGNIVLESGKTFRSQTTTHFNLV